MLRKVNLENTAILAVLFLVLLAGLAILGWGVPVAYVLHGWLVALAAGWGIMWMLNRISAGPA